MVDGSYHNSINTGYGRVHSDGVTNIFDRFESQKKKCVFCERGLSCSLCSMGPCRITEKSPRGACGIDANGMAMRNMLHRNIMGPLHTRTTPARPFRRSFLQHRGRPPTK